MTESRDEGAHGRNLLVLQAIMESECEPLKRAIRRAVDPASLTRYLRGESKPHTNASALHHATQGILAAEHWDPVPELEDAS